jgi:hypothetical protein
MLHGVAMIEQSELINTFLQVANLAHVHVAASDVRAELLPAPHKRPSNLPPSSQVVYAFLLGDRCLKVGKAGPRSQARFTSQHYGFNAPATLAKSLLKHPNHVAVLLPLARQRELETLGETSVGAWIERNTSRFHIFLPTSAEALALSLLKAFLQCRLQPVFEGKVT